MQTDPNFIIIGAGKCGTTSLHQYLAQHPQLYICKKKETYFFLEENERKKFKKYGAVLSQEEYSKLFASAPSDSVTVEISTNYYAYPQSAQIIKEALPNVKIIAILRDPSERAFSSYQMFVKAGNESEKFKDLISADNRYVKRGFYYQQLLPYFENFDRERIKILFFDDLCRDARGFMREFFEYLGVDPQFQPNMEKRGREGGMPKNKALHQLLSKKNPLRSSAAFILKLLFPAEKRQKIRENLVKQNLYKGKLSPESRQELIGLYRDDILQLQTLVGRDLSTWLQ